MDIYTILAGFAVAFTVTITGVGGGAIMTPLLVFGLGIPPAVAVGTDLLYAVGTKSGALIAHGYRGNVQWRAVTWLCLGSLPAAIITIVVLHTLNWQSSDFSALFVPVLSVALMLTALSILFRSQVRNWSLAHSKAHGDGLARLRRPLTVLGGALIGVLVTLTSVGAGALGAAFLFLLYTHWPTRHVVGSDLAQALPLALVAGLGHWFLGHVDVILLAGLLLGSVPGVILGSRFAAQLPDRVLRPVVATLLLLIGLRLVF